MNSMLNLKQGVARAEEGLVTVRSLLATQLEEREVRTNIERLLADARTFSEEMGGVIGERARSTGVIVGEKIGDISQGVLDKVVEKISIDLSDMNDVWDDEEI